MRIFESLSPNVTSLISLDAFLRCASVSSLRIFHVSASGSSGCLSSDSDATNLATLSPNSSFISSIVYSVSSTTS